MKKILLIAAVAFGVMSAQAQEVTTLGKCGDNIQIGIDGGATTPLRGEHFIKDVRGGFGIHIDKMITPAFGLGVEGVATINTSTWEQNGGASNHLAIDQTYVGAYGKVNLFNLFGGYKCKSRVFDMDAVAGCGWGRDWYKYADGGYYNYFVTKAGLNFNFHVTESFAISIKPSVSWNMFGGKKAYTQYDNHNGAFNLFASLSYTFNPGWDCVKPYDQAEIDALNAQINDLKAQLAACEANNAALAAKLKKCEDDLAACLARPAVVKEVAAPTYNSVRMVFFGIGSSQITASQMPNVEMIADYLKNNPGSTVVIKGYASKDGPEELNIKLAAARAEAVKTSLVKKYKIAADRIKAEGCGINESFSELSWNRVAICTVDAKK